MTRGLARLRQERARPVPHVVAGRLSRQPGAACRPAHLFPGRGPSSTCHPASSGSAKQTFTCAGPVSDREVARLVGLLEVDRGRRVDAEQPHLFDGLRGSRTPMGARPVGRHRDDGRRRVVSFHHRRKQFRGRRAGGRHDGHRAPIAAGAPEGEEARAALVEERQHLGRACAAARRAPRRTARSARPGTRRTCGRRPRAAARPRPTRAPGWRSHAPQRPHGLDLVQHFLPLVLVAALRHDAATRPDLQLAVLDTAGSGSPPPRAPSPSASAVRTARRSACARRADRCDASQALPSRAARIDAKRRRRVKPPGDRLEVEPLRRLQPDVHGEVLELPERRAPRGPTPTARPRPRAARAGRPPRSGARRGPSRSLPARRSRRPRQAGASRPPPSWTAGDRPAGRRAARASPRSGTRESAARFRRRPEQAVGVEPGGQRRESGRRRARTAATPRRGRGRPSSPSPARPSSAGHPPADRTACGIPRRIVLRRDGPTRWRPVVALDAVLPGEGPARHALDGIGRHVEPGRPVARHREIGREERRESAAVETRRVRGARRPTSGRRHLSVERRARFASKHSIIAFLPAVTYRLIDRRGGTRSTG